VGYVPFTRDFSAPGDRRRFAHWARARGVPFGIAIPGERYDLLVVSLGGDLSYWQDYPREHGRVVFDVIDRYLAVPLTTWRAALRGTAKFIVGQHRRLQVDFRESLRAMCRRADAVTCCSPEHGSDVLPYCPNVHPVLDFQALTGGHVKSDYAANEPFQLVWEGMPENVVTFETIAPVVESFARHHQIHLHLLTRPHFYKYMGRYSRQDTAVHLRRLLDIPTFFHAWHERTVAPVAIAADLAVIPIPLHHALYAGKPENKLIFFWRLGVPTLVSATPAYQRAMAEAGLDMAARTAGDWAALLDRYLGDEAARREAGRRGRDFALSVHGEAAQLLRWDAAILSAFA
jgi:hypothetical protein